MPKSLARRFYKTLLSGPLLLKPSLLGLGAVAVALPAIALSDSVDMSGIDARRLHEAPYNLTGRKIAIGQVEIGRPGQFGLDKVPASLPVDVSQVFELDGPAIADEAVQGHAANVASVMISQDKRLRGVAPNARLYAAAVGDLSEFKGQPEECVTAQHVALQNSGDVRAMNFSFGEPLTRDPRPNALLDGEALLTHCIDWSSRVHKLLYVIAGNQGRGGIPIPTDNYNAINVAYSTRIGGEFIRVDYANLSSEPFRTSYYGPEPESNVGTRRSISLVAPGSSIEMFEPDGSLTVSSGTSFAAPHVVATVALLQELGDRQFRAETGQWSLASREPLVMKSVILNSADKLKDTGDGNLLGMRRTLLDERGRDWTQGDAYSNPAIPLHKDLGVGHLNAFRAYEQMNAGQHLFGQVPSMGWSYDALGYVDDAGIDFDKHFYVIDQPLQAGSYVNATLVWERVVELNSEDEYFDIGEDFNGRSLTNLDLYLVPIEGDDAQIEDSVWSSVSAEDSVEHIFIPVPKTGRYALVVVKASGEEVEVPYSLAWWTKAEDE